MGSYYPLLFIVAALLNLGANGAVLRRGINLVDRHDSAEKPKGYSIFSDGLGLFHKVKNGINKNMPGIPSAPIFNDLKKTLNNNVNSVMDKIKTSGINLNYMQSLTATAVNVLSDCVFSDVEGSFDDFKDTFEFVSDFIQTLNNCRGNSACYVTFIEKITKENPEVARNVFSHVNMGLKFITTLDQQMIKCAVKTVPTLIGEFVSKERQLE